MCFIYLSSLFLNSLDFLCTQPSKITHYKPNHFVRKLKLRLRRLLSKFILVYPRPTIFTVKYDTKMMHHYYKFLYKHKHLNQIPLTFSFSREKIKRFSFFSYDNLSTRGTNLVTFL